MAAARDKQAISNEIGQRIRAARQESGMSQLQVGVALEVSDKTISGYESGRISPSIEKLIRLADLFKKPISYFLGADPKEYKVASRLRAIEMKLREIREQLREIKLLSQEQSLDDI